MNKRMTTIQKAVCESVATNRIVFVKGEGDGSDELDQLDYEGFVKCADGVRTQIDVWGTKNGAEWRVIINVAE